MVRGLARVAGYRHGLIQVRNLAQCTSPLSGENAQCARRGHLAV